MTDDSVEWPQHCDRCKQPKRVLIVMDDRKLCNACFELDAAEFATFATTLRRRRRERRR
jgi:hypothetical protein